MNDTVQTEILTLEDLQQQKAEALEELRAQQQIMADTIWHRGFRHFMSAPGMCRI